MHSTDFNQFLHDRASSGFIQVWKLESIMPEIALQQSQVNKSQVTRPAEHVLEKAGPVNAIDPITSYQQAFGNQAVQRMLRAKVIQAKLVVNPPDDEYEKEADQVADTPILSSPLGVARETSGEEGSGGAGNVDPGTGGSRGSPGAPINPDPMTQCVPYANPSEAFLVWKTLHAVIPDIAALATRCDEVKPVWEAYFMKTSKSFPFSSYSSCVVTAAQNDPSGSREANKTADALFKNIINNLPITLYKVNMPAHNFNIGQPLAVLHLDLEEAISASAKKFLLHPDIIYNDPFNAAANIAGGVGGKDDRKMGGRVVIEVRSVEPSGKMSGKVRWQPHVCVTDTVDFCPGNLGTTFQRPFTIRMSRLEKGKLTQPVPITIDYDLALRETDFSKDLFMGPMPET
jgi:hypothetical protein